MQSDGFFLPPYHPPPNQTEKKKKPQEVVLSLREWEGIQQEGGWRGGKAENKKTRSWQTFPVTLLRRSFAPLLLGFFAASARERKWEREEEEFIAREEGERKGWEICSPLSSLSLICIWVFSSHLTSLLLLFFLACSNKEARKDCLCCCCPCENGYIYYYCICVLLVSVWLALSPGLRKWGKVGIFSWILEALSPQPSPAGDTVEVRILLLPVVFLASSCCCSCFCFCFCCCCWWCLLFCFRLSV